MTPHTLTGIHHVTAMAGDPQQNLDFYAGLLGLRLVKQTVNFDDPATYHLYYGDRTGRPGTILTFFPWPHGERGRIGNGQVVRVTFAVPAGTLPFWEDDLAGRGVAIRTVVNEFGERVIEFADPDGLPLAIVERQLATDSASRSIERIAGVTLAVSQPDRTQTLLTEVMGLALEHSAGALRRLRFRGEQAEGDPPAVDLVTLSDRSQGRIGPGAVHHVAWRTPTDATQQHWRRHLIEHGLGVSPVMDRQYFHSIYYREPNGVLFEIATDSPGFRIDEPQAALGSKLQLPPWYEPHRSKLERLLPRLRVPAPPAAIGEASHA